MAKAKSVFFCTDCGQESARWMGKCPGCGAWNTMEEAVQKRAPGGTAPERPASRVQRLDETPGKPSERMPSGLAELDRVLGGGFVQDSLVLLGGSPGMGKSTLLLQCAGLFGGAGGVLYVSGEESTSQIRLRAERLGVRKADMGLVAENGMEAILSHIRREDPKLVILDSIQTVYADDIPSAPGSVTQVRECTMRLLLEAKGAGRIVLLVGHVTKSGNLAGPRVLEHMVDTVLYIEGDREGQYRILRSVKNRFGSTQEIGVFEMRKEGLIPVAHPETLFLSRQCRDSGMVVYPALEGSRVFLLEIQALCVRSAFGNPRRLATGYEGNRLLLMLAILEKKLRLRLDATDVYINVAGGMRIAETAADLAVCLAIYSSLRDKPFPPDTLVLGEVGLGGEIRNVPQIERRIAEAKSLGYARIMLPTAQLERSRTDTALPLVGVSQLQEAMTLFSD